MKATPNRDGVVSTNERRNTLMRVIHNTDDKGNKFSVTAHEAASNARPMIFKNHKYIDSYRQDPKFRVRGE